MPKPRNGRKGKPIKATFRIFCEGEKTEPQYFRALIDDLFPGKRNVIVVENCKPNTPIEIVKAAIRSKRSGQEQDEIWVVYDREAVHRYPHRLHKAACDLAHANNINVALSNVCFEFWLLLHFEHTAAQYSSFNDLINRSNLKKCFKDVGLDYDKAAPQTYDKIKHKLEYAKKRAAQIRRTSQQTAETGKNAPYFLNPYVNIDELLVSMSDFVSR